MKKNYFILFTICILFLSCEKKQSFFSKTNMIESEVIKNESELEIKNQEPQFLCWVTSKEGLRVRNIPDLNGNKIGLLDYKTEVQVYDIGKKEKIDNKLAFWLRIKFENNYGWIFGGYVTIIPKTPYTESEILPLTEKNLTGTWTQNTESFHITYFSRGEVFEAGGKYYSGLLHGSLGTIGIYKIDDENQEILITEHIMDDDYMDNTAYTYNLKVERLTSCELIYECLDQDGHMEEPVIRKYNRIPERFLNLEKAPTEEWLRYINKYGNEELFTGSTVFMYSVLNKKNDVALFLINSDIDINHENMNGEKAADFLVGNEDKYLSEILDPKKEKTINSETNDLLNFKPITIENVSEN